MAKIAVLGYGTVGSGVVEVLKRNGRTIAARAGEEIQVKYVFGRRDYKGTEIEQLAVQDYEVIVNDEEVEVVVEVLGGIEPAYTYVKRALLAGKHVVTANKALVAEHGAELLKLAGKWDRNFLFEASVGGGIPIIRALQSSLQADEIEEITGILNGTTNYMLSKMFYEGADYEAVLKEAQAKGYAESNPEADVEGYDACRKLAILASIISGKNVHYGAIYTEGITEVTAVDMQYAKALGMTVKLLAIARKEGEKLSALVTPCMLPSAHPLCNVDGVFNAVFVRGNVLGDAMFYGSGAGKLPTASAVVADVIETVKNKRRTVNKGWSEEVLVPMDKAATEKRFFVRMKGEKDRMKKELALAFGDCEFVTIPERTDEFGFVTPKMTEGAFATGANRFEIVRMIRVES